VVNGEMGTRHWTGEQEAAAVVVAAVEVAAEECTNNADLE